MVRVPFSYVGARRGAEALVVATRHCLRMPRIRRIVVPSVPLHVVQRGVNRDDVFVDDTDRMHYLALLGRACRRLGVAVHAYVLMTNHVHLLLSAGTREAIPAAMHAIGTAYVLGFNQRHGRVGTLWQSRYHSCLVDHDGYLLTVHRYIELNPVRAQMVRRPEEYRWSSVHGNAGYRHDPLLSPHPAYLDLLGGPASAAARHRAALRETLADDTLRVIRLHTATGRGLGGPPPRPRGRPKKGTRTIKQT